LIWIVAVLVITGGLFLSQPGAAETGSAFGGVPAGTGRTLIVDQDNGYASVDGALKAANDGDTILVHSGTYYGRLTVDRAVTITGVDTGGGRPVINGRGMGDVVTITVSGVRLEGFIVKNSYGAGSGILVRADDCIVAGNDVTRCIDGIRIDDARNVTVSGNHVYDNGDAGIYVTNVSDVRVTGNRANDNLYGAYMEKSSDSTLSDNNCSNNIDIDIYLEYMKDSIIRGNTVTSERIKDKKIDGIGIRYGTNVTFDGNYVSRHYYGIKVYESQDCLVENNVADGSGVNIRLDFNTTDTTLRNNTVRNGVDNIYLHSSAYANIVENNTCYNGREGIYVLESAGNVVRANEVYNNSVGIRLVSTTGNTVTGNYAYANNWENINADGGDNLIYGNYDYPPPGRPTPAATTPVPTPALPSPSPTATGSGNPILDFISSLISLIFH
jgi:parallel beta-helix repeat protein